MNKPDLVKLARELQQEVKLMKAEKKEQDELVSGVSSLERGNPVLPYQVAAAIKVTPNKSRMYIINFNLKGQAAIRESTFGTLEHYKIQHKVDQFTADISFRKNILVKDKEPVTETVQEGESDGN